MTTCQINLVPHVPLYHRLVVHHVLPRSWGGPNVPANRVSTCDNCHYNVHSLLNLYRQHQGTPPTTMLATFSAGEQALAAQAWAEHTGPTPLTLAHPDEAQGQK